MTTRLCFTLLALCLIPNNAVAADLDVGVGLGASFRNDSTGSGVTPAVGFSANLGWSLQPQWDWPVRLELAFLTDTFAGGDGVAAVELSSWQGELGALAGFDLGLLELGAGKLGVEALLGPALRLTTVTIRAHENEDTSVVADVVGLGIAGVVYGYRDWRFSLRGITSVSQSRIIHVIHVLACASLRW